MTEKSPTLYPTSPMVIFCRTTRMLALMQSTPILFRFLSFTRACVHVLKINNFCPQVWVSTTAVKPTTQQSSTKSVLHGAFYNHTHLLLGSPTPSQTPVLQGQWQKMKQNAITWRMSHKRNCTSLSSIPSWFDLLPSVSFPEIHLICYISQ